MSTSTEKPVYPFPQLTRITPDTATPTYATLRVAQTELNDNAMSVSSILGDGIQGHLSLVVSPAEYMARSINNVPFVPPVQPPHNPVYPAGANAAARIEIARQFKVDHVEYKLYHETAKALKSQLIAAVAPNFIRALWDKKYGFSTVTVLQLLTHLWTTYGEINEQELTDNL